VQARSLLPTLSFTLLGLAAVAAATGRPLFKAGMEGSAPLIFANGFEVPAPIAMAGADRNVAVSDPQVLDGRASTDPDGRALSYRWTLTTRPAGSLAQLRDATTALLAFVPDVAGTYWLELTVNNAQQSSAPDQLRVRAFNNFGIDSDGDSLSDALEVSLGLDPYNEDSFGDGTRDADRDLDLDGLTIRQELLLGLDPIRADSDGNGINDGAEDFDRDGLDNVAEFLAGSNPLSADTDGDGWPDGAEVDGGSNPVNPASTPRYLGAATPSGGHVLVRPGTGDAGNLPLNPIIADPNQGHVVVRPGTGDAGNLPLNPIIADPNQGHVVVRPGTGDAGNLPLNPIIADPNQGHRLVRPGTGDAGSLSLNPTVAQPPVTIQRPQ